MITSPGHDELQIIPPLVVRITCQDSNIGEDLKHLETLIQADLHLLCYNQDVVNLAFDLVFHAKVKHIKVKHHFARKQVLDEEIALDYIHIDDNLADLVMKHLPRHKFNKH